MPIILNNNSIYAQRVSQNIYIYIRGSVNLLAAKKKKKKKWREKKKELGRKIHMWHVIKI